MRAFLRWVAFGFTTLTMASADTEYERRVAAVRMMPGFVALWDFVKRDPEDRRFAAHQRRNDRNDFRLDALNYVQDYWDLGRAATYEDFPLLGRGPFGQAIRIKAEADANFRPLLMVPRARLHDSGLDVKGAGGSVTLVAWVIREGGNHAIAGIWHEGTDHSTTAGSAARVERGQRQYALFAGLAANTGASAAHVSENGASSFGDRYARNLSVTPGLLRTVPVDAATELLDRSWSVVGLVFDNRRNTVTSYLDGKAEDLWIENPEKHPFFQWPARGWKQAQVGGEAGFPRDQFYQPPEKRPKSVDLISGQGDRRVEVHHFEFTRVRVEYRPGEAPRRELIAIRANPFWFAHDLYAPPDAKTGGPFTIGRVIHMSRGVGMTGYIGGVAVFGKALSRERMARLADVAKGGPIGGR